MCAGKLIPATIRKDRAVADTAKDHLRAHDQMIAVAEGILLSKGKVTAEQVEALIAANAERVAARPKLPKLGAE